MYYGDLVPGQVLYLPFNTFTAAGASVTMAANGTIRVYRDDSLIQATTTGHTLDEDFDLVELTPAGTGRHMITIDTGAATDFYLAGHDYFIAIDQATIDGQVVNAWLGSFSILNRSLSSSLRAPDIAAARL